jgi:hypothetical protein
MYNTVSDAEMRKELQSIKFTDKVEETHGMFSIENKFSELGGIKGFIIEKLKERIGERGRGKEYVTTMDFLTEKAGMEIGQVKTWDMNEAAEVLKIHGLKKVRRKVDGKLSNVYVPSKEYYDNIDLTEEY